MAWDENHREQRLHNLGNDDQRGRFARDRDRILYSSAFRRLAGVTQIVRAGESDVFHTRLTHSLKVAQIGRRLAEFHCREDPDICEKVGGVHPEVVEAACLAHDLGHPPFGHLGEETLNALVEETEPEGFEGNAQSFRIVTNLALRFRRRDGLDLTRATLAAILKYPWRRDPDHPVKRRKWSVYSTEQEEFEFARDGLVGENKTAEAELMDWADDIAYSVHDLEDFHRCRVIPWHMLLNDRPAQDALVKRALDDWNGRPENAEERLHSALSNVLGFARLLGQEPYEGTRDQRRDVRDFTSKLIGRYVRAIKLKEPEEAGGKTVVIEGDKEDEVRILKQITRYYVIQNPTLAAQQRGHRRILNQLFKDLFADATEGPRYLPPRFRDVLVEGKISPSRVIADFITSLSEAQTLAFHARLRGRASGSVLDPIYL